MNRGIIVAVAICGAIAAGVVVVVANHFQGQLEDARSEQRDLRSEIAKLRAAAPSGPDLSGDVATLAKENGDLQARIKELEAELKTFQTELAKADAALSAEAIPDSELDDNNLFDSLTDAFDEVQEEAMREDFRERRAEYAAIARERMNDMMNGYIASADSPEEAERLGAMQTHMNHLSTLYGEMRLVENDEDRDAYREAIDQTRDTIRGLARDQQTSDLREVADQFKIPEDQQDAFLQALEQARENPMMRSPFFTGGGRGGRGGPPGGGGRGGGGGGGGRGQ